MRYPYVTIMPRQRERERGARPPVCQYCAAIADTADRATKLTNQLLAFARRSSLTPEVLDVRAVVSGMTDMLATLSGSFIDIALSLPDTPCPTHADASQLETAIVNLAVNARDAMASVGGGKLTIQTYAVKADQVAELGSDILPIADYTALSISDTGCGIAPSVLGKIFEPFFTTKEVGKGTGLGLSTVYGIVKQSGGFIFADSKVGEGTRFVQKWIDLTAGDASWGVTWSSNVCAHTLHADADGAGTGLSPLLLRTAYSCGTPFLWYTLEGRHDFRFALAPHDGTWQESHSWRLGWEHHQPLAVQRLATARPLAPIPGRDTLPERLSLCALEGDFAATILGESGQSDPDDFLFNVFYTGNGGNLGNFSDPELDRLLEEGRRVADQEQRRQVYVQAQERILDLVPHVFLFHSSQFEALRRDVRGFEHFPNTSYLGLRTAWLDR